MGVGQVIRKTIHARQAAAGLGFERTSEKLDVLRKRLESFKDLSEDNRSFGAQLVSKAADETHTEYVAEADRAPNRRPPSYARHFLQVSAMGGAFIISGALATWAVSNLSSTLGLISAAILSACALAIPKLGLKWHRNKVVEDVNSINSAISGAREAVSAYTHSSSRS